MKPGFPPSFIVHCKQKWEETAADHPPGGPGALPLEWPKPREMGTTLEQDQGKKKQAQLFQVVGADAPTSFPEAQQMVPAEQLPAPSCCAVELQHACGALLIHWSTGLGFLAPSCLMAWRIGRKYYTLPPTCLCMSHKPEQHPSLCVCIIPPPREGWDQVEAHKKMATEPCG